MRTSPVLRLTLGAAALALLVAGCATQPSGREAPLPSAQNAAATPLVVELSESSVARIATALAERLGQRSAVAPERPALRPIPAVPPRTSPVIATRPEPLLPSLSDVATETIRSDAQAAVDRALSWLVRHQADDGSWQADGFVARCGDDICTGSGEATYTPGVTALAVLAFLGNGETQQGGAHASNVKRALQYLRQIQDAEGCIGPRTSPHFQYNHMAGALALAEAYGLTRSPILKIAAQKAVDFVMQSQNPYLGWRYGVRDGDNDTSVTGWAVAVLVSADRAGLAVDHSAFLGAVSWIEKMTEPEFGRVGYNRRGGPTARTQETMERFPSELSEAMTASGVLTRIRVGETPARSEFTRKGLSLIARRPPIWDVDAGTNDFYYWYLGTQAMHHAEAAQRDTWSRRLYTALVPHQITDADDHAFGSWDAVDPWSPNGGRVYATAMLCMSLEFLTR